MKNFFLGKFISIILGFILCLSAQLVSANTLGEGWVKVDSQRPQESTANEKGSQSIDDADDDLNDVANVPPELREEIYQVVLRERIKSQRKGRVKADSASQNMKDLMKISEQIRSLDGALRRLKENFAANKSQTESDIKKGLLVASIAVLLFSVRKFLFPILQAKKIVGFLSHSGFLAAYRLIHDGAIGFSLWNLLDATYYSSQRWSEHREIDKIEAELADKRGELEAAIQNQEVFNDFLTNQRELDKFIEWLQRVRDENKKMIDNLRQFQKVSVSK